MTEWNYICNWYWTYIEYLKLFLNTSFTWRMKISEYFYIEMAFNVLCDFSLNKSEV